MSQKTKLPVPLTPHHSSSHLRTSSLRVAVAACLLGAASPALSLSLGELAIDSYLGERLSAQIPFALAPGEVLSRNCFSPGKLPATGDLPRLRELSFAVHAGNAGGVIRISGQRTVVEPLAELVVSINCNGLPALTRTYPVWLSPPTAAPVAVAETTTPVTRAPIAEVAASIARSQPAPARRPASSTLPRDINAGGSYRVQAGDSLSTIAFRIIERQPNTTWTWAERIQAANPGAFLDGNIDRLQAGSLLEIPLAASAPTRTADLEPAASEPVPAVTPPSLEPPAPIGIGLIETVEPDALPAPADNPSPALVDSGASEPGDAAVFVPQPGGAQPATIGPASEPPQETGTARTRGELTAILMIAIGLLTGLLGFAMVVWRKRKAAADTELDEETVIAPLDHGPTRNMRQPSVAVPVTPRVFETPEPVSELELELHFPDDGIVVSEAVDVGEVTQDNVAITVGDDSMLRDAVAELFAAEDQRPEPPKQLPPELEDLSEPNRTEDFEVDLDMLEQTYVEEFEDTNEISEAFARMRADDDGQEFVDDDATAELVSQLKSDPSVLLFVSRDAVKAPAGEEDESEDDQSESQRPRIPVRRG